LDTNRLKYFCTVSKTGNLRKASEILNISPAALSKSIKLLEKEIGQTLLIPSGRGIILTDIGNKVAKESESILKQVSQIGQFQVEEKNKEGPLKLGAFEVFSTYFLKNFLKLKCLKKSFTIYDLVPGQMEQALIERHIDIGITYIPVPMPELDYFKVTSIEMGIFAKAKKFKKTPFNEIPFVIPVNPLSGSPTKVQGLDGWPDHKVNRKIQYKVSLLESAMEICRQGLAAAHLPKFIIPLHNNHTLPENHLKPLPFPPNFKKQFQDVYVIKRKSDQKDERFLKICKLLNELNQK